MQEEELDDLKVIIYTRKEPLCPWCERAKIFLRARNITYIERDIFSIYEELFVPIAPITVPQIYVNGVLIGGYERMREYFNVV